MNLEILIDRFLEETGYDNDEDVVLIIAYGSRVTSTSREDSDLDILIISSKNGAYRQAIMIDGVPIDVTIMSFDDAEQNIVYSKMKGSTYFDTVLNNGIVKLDKLGTYETLKGLLDCKVKKKRIIDGELFDLAEYHIYQFLNDKEDRNVHYFSALELMRKLYHAKSNCSNIQSSKVFELYTNTQLAKDIYMLKLPDDKYISDYLIALREVDEEKQKEWLVRFFKEFENIQTFSPEGIFFDISQKKIKLININNAIWKCESMILQGHSSSKSLYYIIIGEIYYLYELMNGRKLQVDIDISCTDKEKMIDTLEVLFSFLDNEHNIDYNDYKVKIY